MSTRESNISEIEDELGVRESPLCSLLPDATNVHHWNTRCISELVTNVLRDMGNDEATIAAVQVEFTREAIDGVAFARLGQQELSQRFGPSCGLVLRVLSSALSHFSDASISSQSGPSPAADTTSCREAEEVISKKSVSDASDANVIFEPPTAYVDDVVYVPDGETLVACPMR